MVVSRTGKVKCSSVLDNKLLKQVDRYINTWDVGLLKMQDVMKRYRQELEWQLFSRIKANEKKTLDS